ncbi:uncharacterized protein LOC126383970 [Xyrichtys novacula]|uniref:Uncharacterized protein LOC126383970 n=1 Tax=Xyrichtys novacula TaxID=13765 RepID=A0AAV1GE67_XYRNO|nr:uncharacterized protein LOC126383970 [Xyrichtys novacula]
MAALAWSVLLLCAAGALLSSASPLVVQPGQNISLTCNVTSSRKLTWYLLRSDQLLPLLTVKKTKLKSTSVNFHKDNSQMRSKGSLESGSVILEILQVEEEDTGIYFCSWSYAEKLCVNKGIHLSFPNPPDAPYPWHLAVRAGTVILYLIVMISIVVATWRKAHQIKRRETAGTRDELRVKEAIM